MSRLPLPMLLCLLLLSSVLCPSLAATSSVPVVAVCSKTSSYSVNVSALSGATDSLIAAGYSGHYDTSTGVLVSPFDVLTLSTNSTWCIGTTPPLCSNGAGASTQYVNV